MMGMWPVEQAIWVIANVCIGVSYTLVLAHYSIHTVPILLNQGFVYFCGMGHFGMVIWMALLPHNYLVFLTVCILDSMTALVSVASAWYAWRRRERKGEANAVHRN